jgi:UDP-N-acetylglucosamine 2-epimerase (non-hydrolysing)
MKKILLIFGTRPEAIKMAPVVKALEAERSFDARVCVTAQHREMLDQVLKFFNIIPDYDLNLMKANQTLNELSARILQYIDPVLDDFTPDLVLVHGDTTTSSITALAAFHKNIKVGHVEAGLRTYDTSAPFPEELNRQLTGRIATYHFAPTQQSAANLRNENVKKTSIFITGNTVIDALLWGVKNINIERQEIKTIQNFLEHDKKLIVITGHRRENFGKKFESFCVALKELANRDDVQLIYPVHLNPNVQQVVHQTLANTPNILLLDPLDYEVFIWLLTQSYIIITDSGGVQEEAPSLGKPVLVTREVTERQEAIEQGTVLLVGTEKNKIVSECVDLLTNKEKYTKMSAKSNPYGDGTAAQKIVEALQYLY